MNGKVSIKCTSCGGVFHVHHSKVRSGLSVSCERCRKPIRFDPGSNDLNARRALLAARRLRLGDAGPGQQTVRL